MNVTKEKITPKKAMEWLQRNVNNRKLRKTVVRRYADAMIAGEWKLNGDTIRFNGNGDLIDGQHRLSACIQSDVSFDSYVVRGLDHDAFHTIDGCAPRSIADRLAVEGEVNCRLVAAAIRLVLKIRQGFRANQSFTIRPPQVLQFLDLHPSIRESCRFARGSRIVPESYVGAFHFLFTELDPDMCEQFWSRVLAGESLSRSMPEYWLRERLVSNATSKAKLRDAEVLALIIKAWNYRRKGRTVKTLKWAETEAFPVIE